MERTRDTKEMKDGWKNGRMEGRKDENGDGMGIQCTEEEIGRAHV